MAAEPVECPPPCGADAYLDDSRKTILPNLIRIRLYYCEAGHQFESTEVIVGGVVPRQREKKLINRYSVRTGSGKRRQNDYEL